MGDAALGGQGVAGCETLLLDHGPEQAIEAAYGALCTPGGVVVFPTETVYGLLACLDDKAAYRRIFAIKQRPAGQHIQLLDVRGSTLAEAMLALTTGTGPELAEQFLAGAATLVAPAEALACRGITERILRVQPGSIGVRLPSHPAIEKLLRRLGEPVWATSANTSGTRPLCTTAQVREWLAGLAEVPRLAVVETTTRQGQASDVWMQKDGSWRRLR